MQANKGAYRAVYYTRPPKVRREETAASLIAKRKELRAQRARKLQELKSAGQKEKVKEKEKGKEKEKEKEKAREEKPPSPGFILPTGKEGTQESTIIEVPAGASVSREVSALADTLVGGALSRAQIEREVSLIATQMVWSAINQTVVERELSVYVEDLIRQAIEAAQKSLQNGGAPGGAATAPGEVSPEVDQRIKQISGEIVQEVIEKAKEAYLKETDEQDSAPTEN